MATIPELPLFTSGPLKSGSLNRLRDTIAFWQNPPSALVYATATQSIPSSTGYYIATFQTTGYDTDSIVTSTSRLTAKTPGRYAISARISFSSNATGTRRLQVRKNAGGSETGGTLIASAVEQASSSVTFVDTPAGIEYQLAVGDTVEVFAGQDSGTTLTIPFAVQTDAFLAMRLVSATSTMSGTEATNIADALAQSSLSTADLDTVKAPGNYVQGTAANATLAAHYPVATVTGHLEVLSDGTTSPTLVAQRFIVSSTNALYVRTYSSAAWSAWSLK